jgi:predicted tellurium resistance membrane protein TerC
MIDKIKDKIPIISASLFLIGYLNYHFYFTQFDIFIYTYLSTTELIFSFLTLTIPIILTLSFLVIIFIGGTLSIFRKEEISNGEYDSDMFYEISSINRTWNSLKNVVMKKGKKIFDWVLGIPISIILFLLSIAVSLFLIGYIYLFIHDFISDEPYIGFFGVLLLGIVWITFIFYRINDKKEQELKKRYKSMSFILLGALIIGLLWMSNNEKARKILNGNPQYNVQIQLNDITIKTDSTVVYIGKTSDFIFLRDLSQNENIILSVDKVNEIRMYKN